MRAVPSRSQKARSRDSAIAMSAIVSTIAVDPKRKK